MRDLSESPSNLAAELGFKQFDIAYFSPGLSPLHHASVVSVYVALL